MTSRGSASERQTIDPGGILATPVKDSPDDPSPRLAQPRGGQLDHTGVRPVRLNHDEARIHIAGDDKRGVRGLQGRCIHNREIRRSADSLPIGRPRCDPDDDARLKDPMIEAGDHDPGVADTMRRLMEDPAEVDRVLKDGGERANAIAAPVMDEVRRVIGFWRP